MNHTERIAETARRHRHLTRRMVKEAIETYMELLAEEIAEGEWVDLYSIGKIQVSIENGSGSLVGKNGNTIMGEMRKRLRTRFRLLQEFKDRRYFRGWLGWSIWL